ncbi:hypothetical protein A8C56_01500 [Niabella ginsenosidivorans]|uniref:Oxidoreductase n=1 Tax=Niabella ginsenosidivorans TaxID=1176587 RepID=A0A1A9HX55_9BACT|nr:Gfo/Idh/MocA family oxidoreductase [Niabella ginsenosidivorans]ANH79823.1 hypothetical protein A8C56_01500 [Niabella ginsenosidivorans]
MKTNNSFSRRRFIGQSLAGVAGAGLVNLYGNPLFAQAPQPGKQDKVYRIGIIGCGNRSKATIGSINSVPEIEISALCDIVPHKMAQRAALIKDGPRPRFFTDYQKMLKEADLDAVAVVTPPGLHREHAIAAMEAGKHVFCEKPMALTVADCNAMLKVVEKTGKALQIGTQRRHAADYKLLVETIRTLPVGAIIYSDLNDYRGDWRVPAADEYPPGVGYWRLNQAQSGGAVFEMGAHIIDVNNWIMNSEPVTVSSIQGVNNPLLRKRDSMDHGGVIVRYANNALMNYGSVVYNYGPAAPDTFFGTKATIQFGGGQLSVNYGHPPGAALPDGLPASFKKPLPKGGGEVAQMKYFAEVLAGKKMPYPDGIIGRQTVQICEGSVRASQEHRAINIKELG